ncbi:hypothetical protein CONPUDRAFT_52764, partial [Coniophora puteana RWD-64-598 SS2]
ALNEEFHKNTQILGPRMLTPFARSCVKAGIVSTMLSVLRHEWPRHPNYQGRYYAQYWTMQGLCALLNCGNDSERRSLLKEMLEEDVVGLCLRFMQHGLCVMHHLGINALRTLAEAFLGHHISSNVAAEIVEAVCDYALRGPENIVKQMNNHATAWQSAVFMHKNTPPDAVSERTSRVHAITQDSGMCTLLGILHPFSVQPRNFCLDMLRHKPQILDLLLDCTILDRQPWYPETQVPLKACKALSLLFDCPDYIIPGLSTRFLTKYEESEARDYKTISQVVAVLASRRDWNEKLIEVWMHLEEEDIEKVQRLKRSWMIPMQPNRYAKGTQQKFIRLEVLLGGCRTIILRLIATITHAAQSCGITNIQLESLLHVAYRSFHIDYEDEDLESVDYEYGLVQHPTTSQSPTDPKGIPHAIPNRSILGPIALIQILVVFAQRKALMGIQTIRKAPPGLSSSTSLDHIQQITHPDIIRRAIKISQKRILSTMQRGREYVIDDNSLTCAYFASAAELAVALIALDAHTEGEYTADVRGARKQLVIALGNAAQMALNLGQYQRALRFASGAVSVAENIPADEDLDPAITEKNKRRVNQALARLEYHI